jgi:hypothetical protein
LPPAPTVPSRVTPSLGGEAVRSGRFRGADLSRGLGRRSSGFLPELALLSVSPLAPRQGRSPGGSPLGSSGTGVPDPAVPLFLRRSIGSAFRQDCLWPKPLACLAVLGLASSVCRFAAPGPKPGPARQVGAEALLPPVAARRLASRFLPDRSLDRSPSSCLFGSAPEGPGTWALFEACRFRIR